MHTVCAQMCTLATEEGQVTCRIILCLILLRQLCSCHYSLRAGCAGGYCVYFMGELLMTEVLDNLLSGEQSNNSTQGLAASKVCVPMLWPRSELSPMSQPRQEMCRQSPWRMLGFPLLG